MNKFPKILSPKEASCMQSKLKIRWYNLVLVFITADGACGEV